MRLILIRHGIAEPRDSERWPDDLARPLTARGVKRARRAASGVARLEPGIGKVLTSPAARCVETARLLAGELETTGAVEVLAALAPGSDQRALLRAVAREGKEATVALVGHEPDLSELAAALLGMSPQGLGFKKAAACALDWSGPGPGRTSLKWWLAPAALRTLRGKRKRSAV
jgi:phosphohistidine phosphatase